jgi:uncharacterized protein YfaS (alpha-2-macroglobulin family)
VPAQGGAPDRDDGLTVRRRFLTRDGGPVDPAAVPHGSLVVVELELRATRPVENVAVSDLLPAGLEIQNPRIATRATGVDPDAVKAREPVSGPATATPPPAPPPVISPDPFAVDPFVSSPPPPPPVVEASSVAPETASAPAAKKRPALPRRPLNPSHIERRDDRLLLFADMNSSRVCFIHRYVVRAVTRGRFRLPAVRAECMYDPEIASRHGAGWVQVVEKD